jgi:hypothetical protein
MKRRVRLYKAQEGGAPDINMLGYQGAANQQQQQQPVDDNTLASVILGDIGNSVPREEIVMKLVNVHGKDPMEATQFVDQMYQYVQQQQQEEEDLAESEDDNEEQVISGIDAAVETPMEEEEGMSGTDMANQMIAEDEESYDDTDAASEIIMQYGGYTQDFNTDNDLSRFTGNTSNDFRMGGIPQSKRSYVSSVLKLVKKQMGGDSESKPIATDGSDPTGSDARKNALNAFVGSIKNQSKVAIAKKEAEEAYDQMLANQQMMQQYPMSQDGGEQNIYQGQDFENPMHHLQLLSQSTGNIFQDDQNQIVKGQFGGLFGNRRRNNLTPKGASNFNLPPGAKLDVRKSGWLSGRPKEYSIEYGNAGPMGAAGMPGAPQDFYGYGARTVKTPATRTKIEKEIAAVNNEAVKEVSEKAPESDAAAKGTVTEEQAAAEAQVSTGSGSGSGSGSGTGEKEVKQKSPSVKKDKWGRPSTSKWYNFDPETKKYVKEPTKDKWGRPSTSKWYNFDPETKKYIDKSGKKTEEKKDTKGETTDLRQLLTGTTKEEFDADVKDYESLPWYLKIVTPHPQTVINSKFQSTKTIELPVGPKGILSAGKAAVNVGSKLLPAAQKLLPVAQRALPAAERAIQPGVRMLNQGQNMLGKGQTMLNPGQGMLNQGQGMLNPPPGFQYGLPFQQGGMVNDLSTDPYGNLQKFFGGGDEDFSQDDLDDVYSKDTANGDFPMAQYGAFINKFFPANIMPQQYGQMRGVPYNPNTGQPVANYIPGAGTGVKNVNVTKSSWLTGAPKKYSVTYGTREMDPRKQNIISMPDEDVPLSQKFTNQQMRDQLPEDLDFRSRMQIAKGNRSTARDERRAENYFEDKKQYGGDLERFMPMAQTGMQSPVAYTNNPAMHGMTEVDMISLNQGIQGAAPSTSLTTGFEGTNMPTRDQSKDPKQYNVDPNQIASQQAENVYQGPEDDVTMDFKTKNAVDPEAAINTINAGVAGITGLINRRSNRAAEAKLYENLSADNLYAADPSKDRGDYESNTGLYRPDEMGQTWNSRSKQYGGNIYQEGGMVEGDEVFMTDEEIEEFLANGGDLEFI